MNSRLKAHRHQYTTNNLQGNFFMRPLDLLNLNLNRAVTIQIKRNQRYIGTLSGFDEHLNMYLENVKNEIIVVPEEEPVEELMDDDDEVGEPISKEPSNEEEQLPKPIEKREEEIGSIILRGDNIIFLKIDKPVFAPRQPSRPPYQRQRFNSDDGRRDQGRGPQNRGYQKPSYPRRDQGSGGGYRGGGRGDYQGGRGNRQGPPDRRGSSNRQGPPNRQGPTSRQGPPSRQGQPPRKPQGKPQPRGDE